MAPMLTITAIGSTCKQCQFVMNMCFSGNNLQSSMDLSTSGEASETTPTKTKKLFVTGLSFYTSEKTLRAAFEGFGKLVEVKIIMDKISKRSKGYAFIEYTTEEAASAALREMNGKIINGWMIVVDVAKSSPPRYSRGQSRTATRGKREKVLERFVTKN
ncbi:glycine-rich RNA-binding protein 4, mitochondrial-like [Prunus persica]|uniref:glycine-rich RNA-binding protein 4, mitochondrial-like n=1 Tax=Prunus persica TaxID=3760 RepID=UPI0009AB9064|nr:glycine-rich RNA-binding protein 4, mitochondrial-like [Prunus persica]